jgi:hypothetical protein
VPQVKHFYGISKNPNFGRGRLKISAYLVFSSLTHSVAIMLCSRKPHVRVLLTGIKIQKMPPWGLGGGGGGPNLFYPQFFFCDLKLNTKFHNPRTTPSWRKVCGTEKKTRRKKNNPKNSGSAAMPKGSAYTPLGPIGFMTPLCEVFLEQESDLF